MSRKRVFTGENYTWHTGMACTGMSVSFDERPHVIRKRWVTEDALHDGAWFMAEGRKYADEANGMIARWGRALLLVIIVVWAVERFT